MVKNPPRPQTIKYSIDNYIVKTQKKRLLAYFDDIKKTFDCINHPIPQGFSLILKPYIKVLTHSEKVGWWKSLMVECVSLFCLFIC